MATLVVRRISDGNETESYQIKRRNYGLPVTKMNGVWWCKYNAIGNSRSFDDQILVPQDPAAKAGKTVLEYLKFVAELKKIPKDQRKKQILEVMNLVKITDMQNRLIKNLSKGYRQRVGLAQAVLGFPEIIILDEPSVGLDPKQIIEIRELIRQLAKKHTVILSSHILAEVREVCDYILIISKGKLVASDTPENLERNLGDSDLIEIETKASPDEVRRILETVDGIRSISTKHLENGITWAQIQEKKNTDVREKVFQAFAQNHQPLLKLNPLQVSLEDVFMELTQSDRAAEEYAEKAKKKETEDMKDAGDL